MQKKLVVIACTILAGFSLITTATAQTESINIVTTAVPFLRISPDARAKGLFRPRVFFHTGRGRCRNERHTHSRS